MSLTPVHKARKRDDMKGEKIALASATAGAGATLAGRLLKTKHIFKKSAEEDPYFNAEAAQKAYDLVMKMDADEAYTFATLVMRDVLEDDIEKNRRTLQGHLDKVVAKRLDRIRKVAVSKALENPEQAKEFAEAFSMIAKDVSDPYRGMSVAEFNRAHPRSAKGQFTAKVKATSTKPLKGKDAQRLGIPKPSSKGKLSSRQEAEYQDEYMQVAAFLNTVGQNATGDVNARLRIKDKAGRESYTDLNGTRVSGGEWNPETEHVVGVEARAAGLNVGGASFNLVGALGGSDAAAQGAGRTMNAVDSGFGSFARDWTAGSSNDPRNPNDRTYNRIAAGSRLLGAVAPGPVGQTAAAFGQFVGSQGPQAEAVIGPTARKTAYRYRGTERTPDEKLVNEYGKAIRISQRGDDFDVARRTQIRTAETRAVNTRKAQLAMEAQKKGRTVDRNGIRLPDVEEKAIRAGARQRFERENPVDAAPTFDQRGGGRSMIQNYLMDRGAFARDVDRKNGVAPSARLYGLQLAAGNTPPSEGVMLNADGQIAAQAVGYGDDHYLPFNLKNLSALKGGEYIRSRSMGGLTSEDIYTGLVSGARQVTVTSRSGTFTMTFKDDFRGGRRHNDKAKRMVRRYEQLLDAVQSETVDRVPMDPRMQRQIEREVVEESGEYLDRADIKAEVRRRVEEYKSNPEITEADEARAEAVIQREGQGLDEVRQGILRDQVYNQLREEKETKFRLNGEGYAAALEALREQFPYYIDVKYESTKERDRYEAGSDRGYVRPGANRPFKAQAGLFNPIGGSSTKDSAENAGYATARISTSAGTGSLAPRPEQNSAPAREEPKAAEPETPDPAATEDYVSAATRLRDAIKETGAQAPAGSESWWNLESDKFSSWMIQSPANQNAFDTFARANEESLMGVGSLQSPMTKYKTATGEVGRVKYQPVLAQNWSTKPYKFEGEAYKKDASPEAKESELDAQGSQSGLVVPKPLREMNLQQLEAEVDAIKTVRNSLADSDKVKPNEKAKLLARTFPQGGETLKRVVRDTRAMDAYLEKVHRVRALTNGEPVDAPARTTIEAPNDNAGREDARKKMDLYKNVALQLRDADPIEDNRMRAMAIADKIVGDSLDITSQAQFDSWFDANKDDINFLMERQYNRA